MCDMHMRVHPPCAANRLGARYTVRGGEVQMAMKGMLNHERQHVFKSVLWEHFLAEFVDMSYSAFIILNSVKTIF
jgi:uncharacterized protein (DUF1330 family)